MSEYQYYEFAALDHALDTRGQAELRAISTRATITPTSFINTYEWGDLKADPRKLVERYFDAFLYLSSWGTHRLMLRLPVALLDEQDAASYCVGDSASAWTSGEHTIIDLAAEDEDGVFEEDWSYGGGEGRLASVVPARAELTVGDLRLLYLAWLLCVQVGEVPEDAVEPSVPARLDRLSASQQAAATFLRIDEDLIATAASVAGEDRDNTAASASLRRWLATVPEPEKDAMLLRIARGDTRRTRAELLGRFRAAALAPDREDRVRRTAGELITQAQARRHARERAAQQRRAQQVAARDRAAAVAREKRLASLTGQQERAWRQVDQLIATRKPVEYDAAVALLRDLREVSSREAQVEGVEGYEQRLAQLRRIHHRKTSFIERLDRAELAHR
jgi:hypothetical protein